MNNREHIKIKCQDNFELAGTLYTPTDSIKSAVLLAPATGIKRQFYNSFAKHLAENGFAVMTFDNRGIGGSRGESLNGVNASLVNWGKLDMTAALEYLKGAFPNTDYHLVGHSAGGQLVGLMENAKDLKSMFNFGCSSGSIKYSKYPFKITSIVFLKFFIPICNLLFGHTKSQWLGMGEPLPKQVAIEWSRWCSGTGYVKVDLDKTIKKHLYDDLNFKSQWLHANDDDIANLENVKDMVRVYPNIDAQIITIVPDTYGFKSVGHMAFFSSKKKVLWKYAIGWLNEN